MDEKQMTESAKRYIESLFKDDYSGHDAEPTDQYKAMGIFMDEIGMAWVIDTENGIVWHNGGTGDYNCYLGFKPESGEAVVILSNLSPNYRIPATVLGTKLLSEM